MQTIWLVQFAVGGMHDMMAFEDEEGAKRFTSLYEQMGRDCTLTRIPFVTM